MLARYRAIYAVQTISCSNQAALDVEFIRQDNPNASARLISDPLPYCEEIFAWNLIAEGMLKGMFSGEAALPPDQVPETARKEAALRLKSFSSNCAYLFIDGSYELETPKFDAFRDGEPFGAAFHDTLGPEIVERYSDVLLRALGAVQLMGPAGDTPRLKKVGTRAFLWNEESGKPIYLFRAQGGFGEIYTAHPLSTQNIAELQALATRQPQPHDPLRSLELLNNATDNQEDPLVSFISSWSAFELFVGSLFKQKYLPNMPKRKGKWILREKFEAIAKDRDPKGAATDMAVFDNVYGIRNDLFHEGVFIDLRKATQEAQRLARKYLRSYYGFAP